MCARHSLQYERLRTGGEGWRGVSDMEPLYTSLPKGMLSLLSKMLFLRIYNINVSEKELNVIRETVHMHG